MTPLLRSESVFSIAPSIDWNCNRIYSRVESPKTRLIETTIYCNFAECKLKMSFDLYGFCRDDSSCCIKKVIRNENPEWIIVMIGKLNYMFRDWTLLHPYSNAAAKAIVFIVMVCRHITYLSSVFEFGSSTWMAEPEWKNQNRVCNYVNKGCPFAEFRPQTHWAISNT